MDDPDAERDTGEIRTGNLDEQDGRLGVLEEI
jgi:hypothetical protein